MEWNLINLMIYISDANLPIFLILHSFKLFSLHALKSTAMSLPTSSRTPSLVIVPLLLLLGVALFPLNSDGKRMAGDFEPKEWCIADEQTPDDELQSALDWACGKAGGADCSKLQKNQPCYFPNTIREHASYAFNSYYQRFKRKGATCYFNSAAMVTDLDPSQGSCKYEYLP
ncbi:Glucan endo-1,3-beta-glucosidase 12 [Linum grandiflorum]